MKSKRHKDKARRIGKVKKEKHTFTMKTAVISALKESNLVWQVKRAHPIDIVFQNQSIYVSKNVLCRCGLAEVLSCSTSCKILENLRLMP